MTTSLRISTTKTGEMTPPVCRSSTAGAERPFVVKPVNGDAATKLPSHAGIAYHIVLESQREALAFGAEELQGMRWHALLGQL